MLFSILPHFHVYTEDKECLPQGTCAARGRVSYVQIFKDAVMPDGSSPGKESLAGLLGGAFNQDLSSLTLRHTHRP